MFTFSQNDTGAELFFVAPFIPSTWSPIVVRATGGGEGVLCDDMGLSLFTTADITS